MARMLQLVRGGQQLRLSSLAAMECRAPTAAVSFAGNQARWMATEGAKNKGGGGDSQLGSGFVKTEAGMQELYMRAVEPKPVAVEKAPAAELKKAEEMAKVFTKLMWKRDRVRNRDLQRKLLLKWAAIQALPTPELRKEALRVNPQVPLWGRIATATPPLKGFAALGGGDAAAAGEGEEGGAAGGAGQQAGKPQQSAAAKKAANTAGITSGRRGGAGGSAAGGGSGISLASVLQSSDAPMAGIFGNLGGGGGGSSAAAAPAGGKGGDKQQQGKKK